MIEQMYTESYDAAARRSSKLEAEIERSPQNFRILTGDRPTGRLHIGHYFGTLQSRVRLQGLGVKLFILIADYQVITDRDVSREALQIVPEMLLDYLAIGVDPNVSSIFTHSSVPELNQLVLPFLSLVGVGELDRNPTVKDEIRLSDRPAVNGLMFTYPVHQAADILFMHANLVPVGKDQLPHLELARSIARRFNDRYCQGTDFFPLPEALLGQAPLLLGVDGRKMGKSLGNAIFISSSVDDTADLVRRAVTDGERHISYDPVKRPEVANLLTLAALCREDTPENIAAEVGAKGAAGLKRVVAESVNEYFGPIRKRRAELAEDKEAILQVLRSGNEKARSIAVQTLDDVRDVMGMKYY
jgi:tryptophanyl-tRNA synthetase